MCTETENGFQWEAIFVWSLLEISLKHWRELYRRHKHGVIQTLLSMEFAIIVQYLSLMIIQQEKSQIKLMFSAIWKENPIWSKRFCRCSFYLYSPTQKEKNLNISLQKVHLNKRELAKIKKFSCINSQPIRKRKNKKGHGNWQVNLFHAENKKEIHKPRNWNLALNFQQLPCGLSHPFFSEQFYFSKDYNHIPWLPL